MAERLGGASSHKRLAQLYHKAAGRAKEERGSYVLPASLLGLLSLEHLQQYTS